ncbi:MAG: hypothetical protein LC121_25520 [Anaerolineae bacterium]|mgnify:CR=1 FL=1|nr:hypothetical protein [Anaerolineae bacterium]
MELPGESYLDYQMFRFAQEFGYTPAEFRSMSVADKQRLWGMMRGDVMGRKHRRGEE